MTQEQNHLTGSVHLVNKISDVICSRLAVVAMDAPLIDAAKLLTSTQIGLVVVCDADGKMMGVISKSDVVRQIAHCAGGGCQVAVADVMSRNVLSCSGTDGLANVLESLQTSGYVHLPVADGDCKPVGVVNARDALRFLMLQEQYEESLLRNYVMGVGYQ